MPLHPKAVFKPYLSCFQGHSGRIEVRYALSETGTLSFALYSLAGRTVYVYTAAIVPQRACTVLLPQISNGRYVYRFLTPSKKSSGTVSLMR
jgi:hypothetical protein